MSPPQAQFIDLSTRETDVQARRGRIPPADLAARFPEPAKALYALTARILALHPLPKPVAIDVDHARWFAFLDVLKARVAAGSVFPAQRSMLLSVWDRALALQPSLRRPAVGVSEDGLLRASWSFVDTPGRVFTLDIHRDGALEWFYRDAATNTSRGSEEVPPLELPAEAFELLVAGFGPSTSGSR